MTLNITEREMEYLTAVAKRKGMTKTQIVRHALRVYQLQDEGGIEIKNTIIGIGDLP